MTSIEEYAFYGCSGLKEVKSEILVPFTFGSAAFSGISSNCILTVPYKTKDAYIAKGWTTSVFKGGIKEFFPVVVDGIYYYFNSNTKQATVASGEKKYSGNVIIPSSVTYNDTEYSVTSIGGYAFSDCSGLTSVTIPNSVTSIGSYAFDGCSGLTQVTLNNNDIASKSYNSSSTIGSIFGSQVKEYILGDDVTSIGSYAFESCSGLTSVTIPNSVTSIGSSAFSDCSGLTSVTIGNSVTSIGSSAFSGCSGLTKVTLNSNAIASKSYSSSFTLGSIFGSQVKEYILGENVTSIGSNAFYGCEGLTSLTIPNSVTSIGNSAFYGCSGLTSVHITDIAAWCKISFSNYAANPLSNAKHLFMDGKEITNLVIPNSVTSIGERAFYNCSGLTSVTIPNSVTSIGESAFYGTNLKTLIVGTGMLSFGTNAFSTRPVKTIWLTNTPPQNYTVAQGTVNYVANSQYSSLSNKIEYKFLSSMFEVDGVRYVPVSPSERTCDVIDCIYDESTSEININSTVSYRSINMKVQNVQPYTFYQYTNIKKVSLDIDGSIGKYVFSGCNNLQTVVLGENITGIGDYAFNSCSKLNSIIIPDSVASIGLYAFSGCTGMKSVVIGDGTKTMGQYAFSNCSGITSVEIGKGQKTIGQYAFSDCSGIKSAVIGEGPNTIGGYAFSGCSSLSSVTIGKGANSIGNYAFSGCNSLASISLGEGTGTINQYAFQNCSSLTSITIPGSVNSIGNYAFSGCSGLKTVIMAKRQTGGDLKLGYNGNSPLFVDCPLDSVYIGRNISYSTGSSYGYSPFYRNTSLRTVVITDKETDISENEFYGCTNLQNVQIGDGVTAIGNWAFSGCSRLKNFSFGTHVKTIGKEAFSDCTAVTAITSKAQTPPTCGAQALDDINKWDCVLYVPEGYASSYQNADQWKEFFFIEEKKFDLRGDANGDGEVDMNDATFVTNIILGTEAETEAADVNNDGKINIQDVMFIVNYIKNGKFPDEE